MTCGCECTRGGFCGGCGHAGCGRRSRQRMNYRPGMTLAERRVFVTERVGAHDVARAIDEHLFADHQLTVTGDPYWSLTDGSPGVQLETSSDWIVVYYRGVRVGKISQFMPLDLAKRLVMTYLDYQSHDNA